MAKTPVASEAPTRAELKALIQQHGAELSSQLQAHHRSIFPPEAEKTIRHFSPTEAASLIGIHEGYLRQVASEGKGVSPSIKNGRRSYSVDAIQEIRKQLDQGARGGRRYLPHRGSGVRHHFVVRTQFLQNQYFSARPHKREYHLI
jgi:chromosome partitioning protein